MNDGARHGGSPQPASGKPVAAAAAAAGGSLAPGRTLLARHVRGRWAWLAAVGAVTRHEVRLLMHAPLTLIFQIAFLLALSVLVFLVADFFASDLAAFDLQWTFLPWVALVLAPALAMRGFSDTAGDRGLELALSLPVAASAFVTGKWLAGSLVLLVTLAMTAPFALTVGYLGEPDWGVALAGYTGAALLLVAFYAVALAAAALTREHVAAYVAGLGSLMVVLLLGWDTAALALVDTSAANVLASLSVLSPKHWLDRMSEGRIEAAGLTCLAVLIGLALSAATMALEQRRKGDGGLRLAAYGAIGLSLAVLVVPVLSRIPGAVDMTSEQEFTLHPETLQVARDAPEGTQLEIYYSRDESRIPAAIRQHARRVVNLAEALAAASAGGIDLKVRRTAEDTEREEIALAAGVHRIPMTSGDSFVLGAVVRHGARVGVIPYFDIARGGFLEYDLAVALHTLGAKRTRKVGLLSPLLRAQNAEEPRPGLAMLEDLKRHSDVAIIPHFADELPEGLDALIVIDAPILKRSMLRSIDRHVMAGRGLIALVDPYPRFNRANAKIRPAPGDQIDDITDLLARYGLRFRSGEVVGDANLAALVSGADGQRLGYPFWLRARGPALSGQHPATASLNELLFAEAGSFELTGDEASVTALLESTPKAGTLAVAQFKAGGSAEAAAQFAPADDGGRRVIAAAVSGGLSSAFATEDGAQPTTTESAAVFAVADADWLFDPMALQTVDAGGRTLTRPLNDNTAFLLNLTEIAGGDARLTGIRSRGSVRRTFTRVADMLRTGQERLRTEEADTLAKISGVEDRIAKVLEATGAKTADQLPEPLASEIRDLRTRLLPFRRELRKVRRTMREEVEALRLRLTAFNLAGGPLLAVLLAFCVHALRRRAMPAFKRTQLERRH